MEVTGFFVLCNPLSIYKYKTIEAEYNAIKAMGTMCVIIGYKMTDNRNTKNNVKDCKDKSCDLGV